MTDRDIQIAGAVSLLVSDSYNGTAHDSALVRLAVEAGADADAVLAAVARLRAAVAREVAGLVGERQREMWEAA